MHGGTEMKRLLGVLCIFITFSVYAATFLDTENRLWFTDDIVKNAIVEFVPEDKQQSVADLYQDLMDQETGKISIDSLFKVCRKAGFNTYKYEGFTQCKDFIQKMLTDAQIAEEVNIDGFCPGLDENGNNPNKLRSITDKTRIGDFCSSTNIRMGQVIFKPGYNCSCMATVCNEGFEFQGGACVTRVADGNGDCLREVHKKTSENDNLEKCKAFCGNQYTGRACKYTSVVMSHSTGECICNPNSTEIDNALLSMQRAEERRINSLKYYKVCGDDKGKTGGTEICVEGVFNWINVGMLQAAGLAEEYARVRYNDDIACDNNYRTSWNDDYVRCTSKNSKRYYEFQFDDVKESIDADIQRGVILGICKIYNVSVGVKSCATSCTAEMVRTAQHFGLTATTNGNTCNFSGRSISADEAESKLAKIDGIDNYIFYSGIQIQGSKNVITQLKDYIKSTGKTVRSFDCIRNVDEIKNSLLVGDDDVLRCKLNGQPIDFVFDDFSESWLYVQEDGEAKIQCVVSGGKYADQECFGLTQQQCLEANAVFKKKFPSASGMRWNGKECVLLDSAEAQRYDIYVQAGIGVVAAADCLLLTHTGCLVLAVETAGLATELTTKEFIENRAGEFLAVSTRCNNRDCAIDTIRNAGKVLSVIGSLDAAAANSVDSELARLVDYLEPEDLPNVSDNDWDEIIVQLGGDPDDTAGTALVWLNRIGLGAQFASLATSGYRLVSKAITRLAGKAARTANAASDAARAANATSDAANAASDAGRATNNASDALHANIDAVRNASNKNRARAMYHPDMYATSSASIQSKAQEIFQKLDNIDNMSDDELRALSRLMSEFDAEVAAEAAAKATTAAADVSRATTNAATDGARTASVTADAARTTSRATNSTSDVARTVDNVSDTTTTNAMTSLQSAKSKLYIYGQSFDQTIDDFLYNNGGYPASWRRADLTDAEFDALRTDLRSHDLLLDTDPEGFLRISRISDSATNAAKTTSHATNATADATRTVNASQPSTPYIPHIEIVDSSGFKYGLENFIKNPYNKSYAIRGDLIGILNREMALEDGILFMDPHYVKNNSVFASELAKQATVPNKNKIITAPVYMEMIDDAEDVLSNFVRNLDNNGINRAAIPFSSSGHSMLLVKEGKKYTILDQYGNEDLKLWTDDSAKSAVRSKEKVVSALKKAGVKQDDIVSNDYEMCDNMNKTCSIYTILSAQAALDTDGLFDLVREHNRTGGQSTRWGGDIIEDLVMESADLLVEYAKKALKRF